MEGWTALTVGEACHVVNGGTPKTKVDEYWGGPHAWVTPAEMGNIKSPYLKTTRRTLTDAGLDACSANLLPEQSVIISSRAPIGHLVINTVPMATNQGCKGLHPKVALSTKFLFFYLLYKVEYLNSLGTGATFKELSAAKLKAVRIPLPPLPEQERIVAILDEAFAAIETATANAEKNIENARELFESYMGAKIDPSQFDWKTRELQQDVKFIDYRGRTPQKTDSGLRLITAKNVRMGKLNKHPEEFVSEDSYEILMTRGIPVSGDILFTTEAPLGLVCQLDTEEQVVFAQRIITLQPDRSVIDPSFLHYALRSPQVQKSIHANATGATAQGIKSSRLKKIEISIPQSLESQKKIAKELDQCERSCLNIELLESEKLQHLTNLKQSLLHKAFTGALTAGKNAADQTLSEAGV